MAVTQSTTAARPASIDVYCPCSMLTTPDRSVLGAVTVACPVKIVAVAVVVTVTVGVGSTAWAGSAQFMTRKPGMAKANNHAEYDTSVNSGRGMNVSPGRTYEQNANP